MPLKLIYTIVEMGQVGKLLSGVLSKMFSKICSVAVMSDYFITDSGTVHFAVVWFWTTEFFQTLLRIWDMKDRQQRQRVKTVWQSASWVPFSVLKFWKLKAFSVFMQTLHVHATLTPFCYASNNSSWLARLELTANESGSTSR